MPKLHPVILSFFFAGFCFNLLVLKMTVFASPIELEELQALPLNSETEAKEGAWSFCDFQQPAEAQFNVEFVKSFVSPNLEAGDLFLVEMIYKNTGNTRLFSHQSHCEGQPVLNLGAVAPLDRASRFGMDGVAISGFTSPNRVEMAGEYADPGENLIFRFESHVPQENVDDIYREFFQPVVEGKTWLAGPQLVDIPVGTPSESMKDNIQYVEDLAINAKSLEGLTRNIEVDLSDQRQFARFGDIRVWEMKISSGAGDTPTPVGDYKVLEKQELRIAGGTPRYRMPYWQGFRRDGYGIHALPYLGGSLGYTLWEEAEEHLGRPVSHGCVRTSDGDAEKLYGFTVIGTPVTVHR